MKKSTLVILLAILMMMSMCAGAIGEAAAGHETRKPYTVGNICITVPVEWAETGTIANGDGEGYFFGFEEADEDTDGVAIFAIVQHDSLRTGSGNVVKNGTISEILEQLAADTSSGDEISVVNMKEMHGYEVWHVQELLGEMGASIRMFKVGGLIAMIGVQFQPVDMERAEALAEDMLQSMTIVDEE